MPISTIPFDRDKQFIGRDDVLKKLEAALSDRQSHQRAALWGLGGIG